MFFLLFFDFILFHTVRISDWVFFPSSYCCPKEYEQKCPATNRCCSYEIYVKQCAQWLITVNQCSTDYYVIDFWLKKKKNCSNACVYFLWMKYYRKIMKIWISRIKSRFIFPISHFKVYIFWSKSIRKLFYSSFSSKKQLTHCSLNIQ